MITFSQLGSYGRLGNQLFQYAALKSLGLSRNYKVKIPDPAEKHWHGQNCLLNEFDIECDYLTTEDHNKVSFFYEENNINRFDRNFFYLGDNVDIRGFFQSTKYFERHSQQIKKELMPKKHHLKEAKEFIESYRKNNETIVSVHLRMGDVTDGTNKGYDNLYGSGKDFLTTSSVYGEYFTRAKRVFDSENVKFIVFYGGSRMNLSENESFKEAFGDNFVFSDGASAMQDFSRIINCDHNICGHLTTFGWWAAYLNPSEDKTVTIPKNYFYNPTVRDGFFPTKWRTL